MLVERGAACPWRWRRAALSKAAATHTSLSSSGRTIGGRCDGWSLQMVRMEPPCTDCHSFLWACHRRGSSSGYSLKPATNASFVFTGIMGSRTRVWPSFLFCGGIGFGKHQPPESYWS